MEANKAAEQRFPPDGTNFETAWHYFKNRAVQLLSDRFVWSHAVWPLVEDDVEWGTGTSFQRGDTSYYSCYVYADHRGKGHAKRFVTSAFTPTVTAPDCNIEAFLQAVGAQYVVAAEFTRCQEYQAVQRFYGDRRAAHSGLWLMNHIDEGLAVLTDLGATEAAKKAYCLHPLLQADADLAISAPRHEELTKNPYVLLLALEYRNIANGYLSRREITSSAEIHLGPLPEVHDMLRADKVQNQKDFLLHSPDPTQDARLRRYFRLWLERLDVSDAAFEDWFKRLQV